MNQNYYLCSPWCVWLNFQVPESAAGNVNYNDYLKKVHTITTYNDLAYYLQESLFKDVHNFLVYESQPNVNAVSKFQIKQDTQAISAINYFREGISPKWQDQKNKHGGRLCFQIEKDNDRYQEIYEWLILYFLGESQRCSEQINGLRFISHRSSNTFKFHYRVEVWTKFNSNESDKVMEFRDTFVKDYFKSFLNQSEGSTKQRDFKPSFKNNDQEKKTQDTEKDKKATN